MDYGVLFTGQGSQFPGMARELIENFVSAREIFEKADEVLGYSVTDICTKEEQFTKMEKTMFAQPAIFVTEYALFSLFEDYLDGKEYRPSFMAGHSLGEYTALAASGVMDFEDVLRIVAKRGEYMSEAADRHRSCMISVSSLPSNCRKVLGQYISENGEVFLSCDNHEDQAVYSVSAEKKEGFMFFLDSLNAKAKPLAVEGGFHSRFMKEAAEKLKKELEGCSFRRPCCPIYSNTCGKIYRSEKEMREMLSRHLTECVCWRKIIEEIKRQSPSLILEIGPLPTLSISLKSEMPQANIQYFGPSGDIEKRTEEIRSLMDEQRVKAIKKKVRNLVCRKSDGGEESLRRREGIYEVWMHLIAKGHISREELAYADKMDEQLRVYS